MVHTLLTLSAIDKARCIVIQVGAVHKMVHQYYGAVAWSEDRAALEAYQTA